MSRSEWILEIVRLKLRLSPVPVRLPYRRPWFG